MLKKNLNAIILLASLWGCAHRVPPVISQEIGQAESTYSDVRALPGGVSIHRLDNGMEVLLIENPALPMVGVNVVVKSGSAYETFATSGMSHMLEHLLFNGTATRTQKQLYDDVDRIGGYNNANTSEFYTNYMMVTPAEHIQKGMEIQSDMLFNSILPPEKFEKEKGIVLEEIARSLAKPDEQIERNILSILYRGHALSLPTLGTYATIESMSREDVYDFYKGNYVPNNMILSAVGNFRSDSMLVMIKKIYGDAVPGAVLRGGHPGWSTGFQHPEVASVHSGQVYHRFYDGDAGKLQLFYRLPDDASAEFVTLLDILLDKHIDSLQTAIKTTFPDLVKSIQFESRRSVLANHLQVTVNLVTEGDYDSLTDTLQGHLLQLNLTLPPESVQSQAVKARTSFLKNIEKPHMFGIFNAHEFAVDGIESVLASYTGIRYYQAAERLENFRLSGRPLIIIQHPAAKSRSEQVLAATNKALFENRAQGATVIAKQNGASDLLAIHYLLKHKARYENQFGKDAAKVLHNCLEQRLTSAQNKKISSRFGFTYKFNDNPYFPMDDIYLHPDFGYIRVEGLADDLAGAIDFLNRHMSGFEPTPEEFEKARLKFQRSADMMGGQEAKKLFEQTYKALIYEPAKYPESDSSLTYETLVAFAREYFHPANMVISVVSPVAPDSVHKLFSGLASETGLVTGTDEAAWDRTLRIPTEPARVEKEGGGEQSHLFWGFLREIEPEDKSALQALSLILADRIVFDIREKQGLAYRMSAGIELNKDKALFYIRMGTRPQNVEKLVPQYPGFFDAASIASLTASELEKAINMYLGRMMFRRLSSINQAYYLAHSYYFYNDMDYDSRFLDQLKRVSVDEVKRVAQKYLRAHNPVSVIVR